MKLSHPSSVHITGHAAGFVALVLALTMLPGCAVIGGIFKAGVWVGVVAVVAVLAVVGGIVAMLGKR